METLLLVDNAARAAREGKAFVRRRPTDDRVITTVAAARAADARTVADPFTELTWLTIEPSNQSYPF